MEKIKGLRGGNTATYRDGETVRIVFHNTAVFTIAPDWVKLDSGGWRSATTKRRINDAAALYGLPLEVKQVKGAWLVVVNGDRVHRFVDGLTLDRRTWEAIGSA